MSGLGASTLATRGTGNGQVHERSLLQQLAPGQPTGRRNWPRVGAAAALALLCGATFVLLYSSAGARRPFLAVARPVPVDGTITAADLVTARVAPDAGLAPIPVQDTAGVIGRRAAVALVPGTLLTAGDLAAGPILGSRSSSVGLDLKPGELPAGLGVGDAVLVVETAGPSATAGPGTAAGGAPSGAPTVLVDHATVLSVGQPSAGAGTGDTEVTIGVPSTLAAVVVTAAAAGDVALAGLSPQGAR